jgi:hypothetical protein
MVFSHITSHTGCIIAPVLGKFVVWCIWHGLFTIGVVIPICSCVFIVRWIGDRSSLQLSHVGYLAPF